MPINLTSFLKFKKTVAQAQNTVLVNEFLDRADKRLGGVLALPVSGSVSLTSAQADHSMIVCSGSGGTILTGAEIGTWVFHNATSGALVIKANGGDTGVSIAPGDSSVGWSNGANLRGVAAPSASSAAPPLVCAHVANSSNQAIPNLVSSALSFDTEREDSSGMHSNVNNSRLTCVQAGRYLIRCSLIFSANNVGGSRSIALRMNGSLLLGAQNGPVMNANTHLTISLDYRLAVNDYVEAMAYQDSGGALNSLVIPALGPEFSMVRLGA
jgi:hypothetical protein